MKKNIQMSAPSKSGKFLKGSDSTKSGKKE